MPDIINQANSYGASEMFPITPDDDEVIRPVRALYVTADGDLEYVDDVGNADTVPVTVGVFPFRPVKITEGTTATVFGMR